MTNVDLVDAIEMVRYYRDRLYESEVWMTTSNDRDALFHLDHNIESLADAEKRLATVMIELQSGYDLALLPKQGISS